MTRPIGSRTAGGEGPGGGTLQTAVEVPSDGPSNVQADLDALKYIESAADLEARFPAVLGVHTIDQGSEWRLPKGAVEIDIGSNTIVGVFPGGITFVGAQGRITTNVDATLASGELAVKNVAFANSNPGASALCVDFESLFGRTLVINRMAVIGLHPGRIANVVGVGRYTDIDIIPVAPGSSSLEIDGTNGPSIFRSTSVIAPGTAPYSGIRVLATASVPAMGILTSAVQTQLAGDAMIYVDPAVSMPPTGTLTVTTSTVIGPGAMFDTSALGLDESDPEIFAINNIDSPSSKWLADVVYDSAGGSAITLNMSGGVEVMPSENAGPTAVATMLGDSERFVTPLAITALQDWEAVSTSRTNAIQGEVSWSATVKRNGGSVRQITGWVQYRAGPDPAGWNTIEGSIGERPMGTLYEQVRGSSPFQWDRTFEFRLVIQGTAATLTDIKTWRMQIGQGRP